MGSMGLLFVVVMLFAVVMEVGGATTEEKCSSEFQKVTACLGYATGKAEAPTKECCTSVTDIKNKDPTCLCYVIQQANSGNPQIKSLGIQVSRLLQLSSACKLANATLADCPKLLNIPPSSPDYAIFTNSSASVSTTPAAATGTTSSPTVKGIGGSDGVKHVPQLAGLVAVATALALCAFPFFEVLPTIFHT